MDKTLRKTLTAPHPHTLAGSGAGARNGDTSWPAATLYQTDLMDDMNILNEAAKDLLQPRPEAITRILAMAREL